MKNTSIPAQITTVEDRIIGNITLTQLGLLGAPLFICFALFAALPKPMHFYLYKALIMILISPFLLVLALRVKGKLVLFWAITLLKFKSRTKTFVFNKNNLLFRSDIEPIQIQHPQTWSLKEPTLSVARSQSILEFHSDPRVLVKELNFIEEKKGKLYVYVSETK